MKVINTPGSKAAKGGGVAFNPIAGMLNTQQLSQLANQITKQNMQAQLSPLRQQAGEIRNTEGTVANRYKGYSEATDKLLQGIGSQAEASAKTYENQAADAALKAGQAINQTGASAAAQNGGYVDPQVQAELDAEGKLAAGTGGAQNSFAQAAGQNEQSFMGNLRAAAAQRAIEGQHGIQNLYGGQLSKNQQKQQALIEKQPSDAKSLAVELGQRQFNDYAVQRKQNLEEGVKTAGVHQNAEKIKLDVVKQAAAERQRNVDNAFKARDLATKERTQRDTERIRSINAELKAAGQNETKRHNLASEKLQLQKDSGQLPSKTEGRKYMALLDRAYGYAKSFLVSQKGNQALVRQQLQAGAGTGPGGEKGGSGFSPDVVAAAMNLAVYGRLSRSDMTIAETYGMTPHMRPEWFRTH